MKEINTAKTISKIKLYSENARKLAPHITDDMLDNAGTIYYMNGNDGTMFDWIENDRLCEFMIFAKNQKGFIKIFVEENDCINGYMYETFDGEPTHTLEPMQLDDGETANLFAAMFWLADMPRIWDAPIDSFDFENPSLASLFEL